MNELYELPKGWEWKKLEELCEIIKTGTTPPKKENKYYNNATINWLSPSDFGEHKELNTSKNKITKPALIEKKAKLYASYDEKNELGSMAFFAWDNKRAYYIFGASDPDKRNGHSGTNVLWEAFYDLSKMGINEVDLEGINSPQRGWFKLSFGGDIRPYYEIKLK